MNYPARYKAELLNAIQSIDLEKVNQIIDIFREALALGHRIFVCGDSGNSIASQFLCEMVNSTSFNRSVRFRILALRDQLPKVVSHQQRELAQDRVFVEQLKNFAEPDDVVMG